jgi:hypothetical protein
VNGDDGALHVDEIVLAQTASSPFCETNIVPHKSSGHLVIGAFGHLVGHLIGQLSGAAQSMTKDHMTKWPKTNDQVTKSPEDRIFPPTVP